MEAKIVGISTIFLADLTDVPAPDPVGGWGAIPPLGGVVHVNWIFDDINWIWIAACAVNTGSTNHGVQVQ